MTPNSTSTISAAVAPALTAASACAPYDGTAPPTATSAAKPDQRQRLRIERFGLDSAGAVAVLRKAGVVDGQTAQSLRVVQVDSPFCAGGVRQLPESDRVRRLFWRWHPRSPIVGPSPAGPRITQIR